MEENRKRAEHDRQKCIEIIRKVTNKQFTIAVQPEMSSDLQEAEWQYRYNRQEGYDATSKRDLPPVLQKAVTLATTFDPDERINSENFASDTEIDSPTSPAEPPCAAHAAARLSPQHYPSRDQHLLQAVHYHRSIDMLTDDTMAMKGSPDVEPEWSQSDRWLLDNAIGHITSETAMALSVGSVVVCDLSQMWTNHSTQDMLQGCQSRVRLQQKQRIQDESAPYNEESRTREREDRNYNAMNELANIIRPYRSQSGAHYERVKDIVLEDHKKAGRLAAEELWQ